MTRRFAWAAVCIALVVVALAVWHLAYRLTAASRAVDVVRSGVPSSPESSPALIVLAYNIAHGRGLADRNWGGGDATERRERLDAIATVLREADADVVVLNEVDFDAPWSGGIDQAVFLAEHAGYGWIARQRNVDVSLPLYRVCFGNTVLSRHPIASASLVDLPAFAPFESFIAGKKQGLLVEIHTDGGQPFRVFAVHFEHRDEATRVDSAERLIAACHASDVPLIALGDFNSHPPGTSNAPRDADGRNTIATLIDSGTLISGSTSSLGTSDKTFPSTGPTRTIDWVFTTPHFRVIAGGVIECEHSDHLPVYSVLE